MEKKHNIVYKIRNKVNGKIYVGKHSTDDLDDGYLGSGKAILQAVAKYGKENFTRETIVDVDTAAEALDLESIIVDDDFINRPDVYNLCLGGRGDTSVCRTPEAIAKAVATRKRMYRAGELVPWNKGKKMSKKHRQVLSGAHKGKRNSDESYAKARATRRRSIEEGNNPQCRHMIRYVEGDYVSHSWAIMSKHLGRTSTWLIIHWKKRGKLDKFRLKKYGTFKVTNLDEYTSKKI